jgi:hypothetical protein
MEPGNVMRPLGLLAFSGEGCSACGPEIPPHPSGNGGVEGSGVFPAGRSLAHRSISFFEMIPEEFPQGILRRRSA